MSLNNNEIADRIFRCKDKRKRLSIIPEPEEKAFRAEAGASVDLHLGRWFCTMRQANIPYLNLQSENTEKAIRTEKRRVEVAKEVFIPFKEKFYLHPGKFVLGNTLEWITFPGDITGYVTGKSSWGRRGLIIETSAGIHPGFSGCLTLELANVGEIPLALTPGMKICQIFLHLASSHRIDASSQFKGSRKPWLGANFSD